MDTYDVMLCRDRIDRCGLLSIYIQTQREERYVTISSLVLVKCRTALDSIYHVGEIAHIFISTRPILFHSTSAKRLSIGMAPANGRGIYRGSKMRHVRHMRDIY